MTNSRPPQPESDIAARRRWLGILARADRPALERALESLAERPAYRLLRAPESGLVMVRGRAGGSGRPFNLGEMTVARCSLQLADGTIGHSYAAGRDLRKAELAALFDALLQTAAAPQVERMLIEPLAGQMAARREITSRKAAATKVDFVGMVRAK
jgi:alpha-D-ribose 1-methylphosphonate 5-triphosphate synthase subunit PhnG